MPIGGEWMGLELRAATVAEGETAWVGVDRIFTDVGCDGFDDE